MRHDPVSKTEFEIKRVCTALDAFRRNHNLYPETLEDLVYMPAYVEARNWIPGGYLKKLARDGWGNEMIYRVPGTEGQPYDIVSVGADQRMGGEGINADIWNHKFGKH